MSNNSLKKLKSQYISFDILSGFRPRCFGDKMTVKTITLQTQEKQ